MAKLQDRVAVVTGGARGIGRSIALGMAREGAVVVAVDIDTSGTDDLTAEADEAASTIVLRQADVADGDAMKAIIDEAVGTFGRLDVLVNNAAAMEPWVMRTDVNVETTPVETWDRAYAVNIRGPFLAAKYAVPHMLKTTGAGNVINISTPAGFNGDVAGVAYSTSKAALHGLTRSIATSHGRLGVRSNCIAPGLILTEAALQNMSLEQRQARRRHRLVRRPGWPVDVAALAVFLASDDSGYITGQTIIMDGGISSVHQPWYADSAVTHPDMVEEDFGEDLGEV
jgi:NAD(P)-dependent dehydrogenase (short-subunit alcohol dehydrogenase family)